MHWNFMYISAIVIICLHKIHFFLMLFIVINCSNMPAFYTKVIILGNFSLHESRSMQSQKWVFLQSFAIPYMWEIKILHKVGTIQSQKCCILAYRIREKSKFFTHLVPAMMMTGYSPLDIIFTTAITILYCNQGSRCQSPLCQIMEKCFIWREKEWLKSPNCESPNDVIVQLNVFCET